MITVHHLNYSRSHRIIWLLEELGLKYKIKYYERDKKTLLAPPSLLKIAPLGKSPIITDGKLTLAESGAIIEYILNKYGKNKLNPTLGSPEWIQYIYWLHFAEGSLMPQIMIRSIFEMVYLKSPLLLKPITKAIRNQVIEKFQPNLTNQLNLIEDTLTKTKWLAGKNFTAADIQMGITIILSDLEKGTDVKRPKIQEFIETIQKRPAYIRTIELAGPISFREFLARPDVKF